MNCIVRFSPETFLWQFEFCQPYHSFILYDSFDGVEKDISNEYEILEIFFSPLKKKIRYRINYIMIKFATMLNTIEKGRLRWRKSRCVVGTLPSFDLASPISVRSRWTIILLVKNSATVRLLKYSGRFVS